MKLDDDSKIGRTKNGALPTPLAIAFGKHPAWSDHINDPALVRKDTPELEFLLGLLQTRQYEEVIRRGTWAKLEDERRHDDVDCLVVRWRRGAGTGGTTVITSPGAKPPEPVVVSFAEVWASADALGRSEQVFVVACDSQQELDADGLAELDEAVLTAKGEIKATALAANRAIESKRLGKPMPAGALEKNAAQDAVRATIAELREQLADLDGPAVRPPAGPGPAPASVTAAATGPAVPGPMTSGPLGPATPSDGKASPGGAGPEVSSAGPDGVSASSAGSASPPEGLAKPGSGGGEPKSLVTGLGELGPDAMYRIAYRLRSASNKWQKSGQGQLIRVPSVGGWSPSHAAFEWRRLLLTLIPGGFGLTIILHRGIPAVDIILGEVGADHVEALRMNTKQLAPESEVPYSGATDGAFRAMVDEALRGERPGILVSDGASTSSSPSSSPSSGTSSGAGAGGKEAAFGGAGSSDRREKSVANPKLKNRLSVPLLLGLFGLGLLVLIGVIYIFVRK